MTIPLRYHALIIDRISEDNAGALALFQKSPMMPPYARVCFTLNDGVAHLVTSRGVEPTDTRILPPVNPKLKPFMQHSLETIIDSLDASEVTYHGTDLRETIRYRFVRFFKSDAVNFALVRKGAEQLFQTHPPHSAVAFNNGLNKFRAVLEAARAVGAITAECPPANYVQNGLRPPFVAERIGAVDQAFCAIFSEQFDVARDRVREFSHPAIMRILEETRSKKARAAEGLEPIDILYLTVNYSRDSAVTPFLEMMEILKNDPALHMAVRLHSGEAGFTREVFLALAQENGVCEQISLVKGYLAAEVARSTVVVSPHSSALYIPLFLRTPVVIPAFSMDVMPYDPAAMGHGERADTAAEMREKILALLSDPEERERHQRRCEAYLEDNPHFLKTQGIDSLISEHPEA